MKKKMNLYKKYKKDNNRQRSLNRGGLMTVVSIALVLIMLATGVRFTIEKMILKSDVNDLKLFVEDENNIVKYNESKKISETNAKLTSFKDSLSEIDSIFKEKDAIGSYILTEIHMAKPNSIVITNMSIDGPLVSISYESSVPSASSDFIKSLKERNIIKEVDYNGYTYDEEQETYSATATLILRGNF